MRIDTSTVATDASMETELLTGADEAYSFVNVEASLPEVAVSLKVIPKRKVIGVTAPATIQDEEQEGDSSQQQQQRSKWREPTRDAVKMSLGGKRRLAQDLYLIMIQDTIEAGFSLEPSQEDSIDKWTIKLFKFDQDSNLAKDMLVLGITSIELEMTFPDQYPFEPSATKIQARDGDCHGWSSLHGTNHQG
jgi:hypothetical protein